MDIKVTEETCYKMARLARLAITQEQIPIVQGNLQDTLNLMAKFAEVDLAETELTVNLTQNDTVTMREDIAHPSPGASEMLANAPSSAYEQFFTVPKVINN
jgi:aspartyl-tRNA(Asn)/glutamyl-tRNA(Gln) amidotransferase subunit C